MLISTRTAKNCRSASYGFADRVVEGLSLFVNTIEIEFSSPKFHGSIMARIRPLSRAEKRRFSLQLSRLEVASQTPRWLPTTDLKTTRFHCHETHKIMFFKAVGWQLLRIEARAIGSDTPTNTRQQSFSSPLRLITNNGSCRIAIKKSSAGAKSLPIFLRSFAPIADNSLVCGRLQMILDEILWVVSLPQLREAIAFGKHLAELIETNAEILRQHATKQQLQHFVRPQIARFCFMMTF